MEKKEKLLWETREICPHCCVMVRDMDASSTKEEALAVKKVGCMCCGCTLIEIFYYKKGERIFFSQQ